jgi:hypothetical protein
VNLTLDPLTAQASDKTPLYFVDGTHPSYTAYAAYGWIRKGETRELKSNHGRTNININGALSWPGRDFVHRQTGRITSAEMILLFADLQARHPTATAIRGDAGQRPLQPLERDQSLAGLRRLPCRAGLSAALCTEPQSDRAVLVAV